MELGYLENLKLFITLLIAFVAFVALWRNRIYFERSIRTEKIELTYAIVESLATAYYGIYTPYLNLCQYHREDHDSVSRKHALDVYRESVETFHLNYNMQDIYTKLSQLEVLSRSYLRKGLCLKVMAFKRMYQHLAMCALQMDWLTKDALWREGFPAAEQVGIYVDELTDLLIDEIDFSRGNAGFREKLRVYTENTFKQAVGLK